MGEKLVREALEYVKSPDALTTPERMHLVKMAADADDVTRRVSYFSDDPLYPDVDGVLIALIAKGALEQRADGMFFTEMTLADAYKAYRVMSGVGSTDEEG